jgi:antitoxin VapB
MLAYMKNTKAATLRRVKVFRNGRNQAVRIPHEFEFPGKDAIMRREGKRLVIEPLVPRSLLRVLARLKPLKEDFPPLEDKPPGPVGI